MNLLKYVDRPLMICEVLVLLFAYWLAGWVGVFLLLAGTVHAGVLVGVLAAKNRADAQPNAAP